MHYEENLDCIYSPDDALIDWNIFFNVVCCETLLKYYPQFFIYHQHSHHIMLKEAGFMKMN